MKTMNAFAGSDVSASAPTGAQPVRGLSRAASGSAYPAGASGDERPSDLGRPPGEAGAARSAPTPGRRAHRTPAAPEAPSRRARPQSPVWFITWMAVGAALALGISALGVFAVPVAVLGAVALIAGHRGGRAALGALVGAGLPLLVVAYVQRRGPGTFSWHTATAAGSTQYLDPRPWLAAGLVLIAAGIVAYAWSAHRGAGAGGRQRL